MSRWGKGETKEDVMTKIEQDQIKLTAAYLNCCAMALLAMGGFGLVLATTLATTSLVEGVSSAIYGVLYLVMVGSVMVHAVARLYLKQLDSNTHTSRSQQPI